MPLTDHGCGSPDREIHRSDLLRVRYRLQAGKIVEIWTAPRNYVFVLGRLMNSQPGFLLILLRFRLWGAREKERLSRRFGSA